MTADAGPVRTFVAVVQRPDEGPGHAIAVPFDPVVVFGRVRVPVLVTIGDEQPFRTTLAAYGGTAWIGLRKAQLAGFGITAGDSVSVTVRPDVEPRTVDVPEDLASALDAAPGAQAAFDRLSFSHRREYALWVAAAKRADTRVRRAATTVQRLLGSPG